MVMWFGWSVEYFSVSDLPIAIPFGALDQLPECSSDPDAGFVSSPRIKLGIFYM